jgi:DNA-3-methyladenine glycosylase II
VARHSPAIAHLSKVDPVMRKLLRDIGPCTLVPQIGCSPFESLVRAIAYQQLHANAAEAILGRLLALYPGRRFPEPIDILTTHWRSMRRVGFSRAKIAALRDLAARALDGTVPTNREIRRLDDEAIVERLVAVRGVGRWTAEMLLIFHLGRPDVLPVDDFGVRNGFRIAYGRRSMPTAKSMLRYGERWKPYRTIASWYLWRAAAAAQRKQTGRITG